MLAFELNKLLEFFIVLVALFNLKVDEEAVVVVEVKQVISTINVVLVLLIELFAVQGGNEFV